MYPQIRYTLYLILTIIILGISAYIWKKLPQDEVEVVESEQSQIGETATPEIDAGAEELPEAPPVVTDITDKPAVPVAPSSDVPTPAATAEQPPEVAPPAPAPEPEAKTDELVRKILDASQNQFNAGYLEASRRLASNVLKREDVEEFDKNWKQAAAIVNQINKRLMNSAAPGPEKKNYVIKSGDSVDRIARRHFLTTGALRRMNPQSISNTNSTIYPGKTLMVLKAKWSIRVVKHHYILLLMNGDELYRTYDIATGRENRTPEGTFEIYNKVIHPDWTHPSGTVIPYGSKENVLGTHWMAIRPTGTTNPTLRGFGIHGTWDENSIGTSASLGCVRMLNEDVEELYDFIPIPRKGSPCTPVLIEK